jgi:hypothetical protein
MKNLLLKIKNIVNWQKIKYQNGNRYRKKILNKWIAEGRKAPPPHVLKQDVVKYFQKTYEVKILVETGTFRGEMVYAQRKNFEKIISIELSPELFQIAKKRFKNYKHIELICGDSGIILERIIKKINRPAVFWLDGHYSGFETAKGSLETPVKHELETILKSELNDIILIDDARMFTGENDYPPIQAIKDIVLSRKSNYLLNVEDDIIRIFPALQ